MTALRTTLLSALLLGASLQATAGEMRCGNQLIFDDQIDPMLMVQVLEKCGEPTERRGNEWYYQEQGKVLIFNDNQQLESIQDASED